MAGPSAEPSAVRRRTPPVPPATALKREGSATTVSAESPEANAPEDLPPARQSGRYTGLVMLIVVGLVALGAGVAWGVATRSTSSPTAAPERTTSSPPPQATASPTLLGEPELDEYRAASVTAVQQADGILVSWQNPRRLDQILVFVAISEVNGQPQTQQTVGAGGRSVLFSGLLPDRYYCFVVATVVQQPANSSGTAASQPVCAATNAQPASAPPSQAPTSPVPTS